MREWKVEDFYKPFEAQIGDAISRGHDVQLHLHPHWLTSTYDNGVINPSQKYSLHGYRNDPFPNNIAGIVERGVDYLNTICKPLNKGYRCIAFRAGGYDICRSTAEILTALWQNGIRIDSSIARGFRFESNIASIDFSNMPSNANWHIPLEGPLNNFSAHGMFEVPIVSAKRTPLNNLPYLFKRAMFKKKAQKTGTGMHDLHTNALRKLKRLMPFSAWMLSFDDSCFDARYLEKMLAKYIHQFADDQIVFASAISHPKSMSDANFRIMCDFIELARKKYGEKIEFGTFQNVYDLITQ